MNRFNTPTAIMLWPNISPSITAINTKFHERFPFEADPKGVPNDMKGVTCVEIDKGVVRSFVEQAVQRTVWRDPLEEQDLVLITDNSLPASSPATTYQECRNILNLVCPVKTNKVVTFASQANSKLESGFRISVAVALQRDVDGLNSRIDLYQGRRIVGPAGVMLGVAAELDQSAFCIVIEHAPDSQFVSSAAIKAAMLAFSRITAIEAGRGKMSEQAIRMRKHMKQAAEERNREYQEKQSNSDSSEKENSYFESAQSIEEELRLEENIQWIEQLFEGLNDGKDEQDHSRKLFLKSELDRLGLYKQFEHRFLDLWRQRSSQ